MTQNTFNWYNNERPSKTIIITLSHSSKIFSFAHSSNLTVQNKIPIMIWLMFLVQFIVVICQIMYEYPTESPRILIKSTDKYHFFIHANSIVVLFSTCQWIIFRCQPYNFSFQIPLILFLLIDVIAILPLLLLLLLLL